MGTNVCSTFLWGGDGISAEDLAEDLGLGSPEVPPGGPPGGVPPPGAPVPPEHTIPPGPPVGASLCICEDESWSDRNILGRASCVPAVAHETFGWVGLVFSVGVLCHAAHHLRRQVGGAVLQELRVGRRFYFAGV